MKTIFKRFKGRVLVVIALALAAGFSVATVATVLSQKNLALPQLLFTITVYGIPASFLIFFITACLVVPKGRPSKGDDSDDKPPFGDSGLDTLALYGNTANIIPDNPEHYNIL